MPQRGAQGMRDVAQQLLLRGGHFGQLLLAAGQRGAQRSQLLMRLLGGWHGLGWRVGGHQTGRLVWLSGLPLSAPAALLLVMVLPAPTVPPAPMVTGATSTQLLPMCASASITVRCLLAPSALAGMLPAP